MGEETPIISVKQCFSRIGAAYFTLAALTILLQGVLVMAFELAAPELTSAPWYIWVVSLVPMYLIAMPVCAAMLGRIPQAEAEQAKLGVGGFFKWLLISFGVMYAGSLLGQLVMSALRAGFGIEPTTLVNDMISQSSMLMSFVGTVLCAPVMEELMFRKLLIDRVRPFGDKLAVVLSGLMFGLFHGNFEQFFYAAGVGMVFAYVYIRTGRLRYAIALHMCVNFSGAVVAPLVVYSAADVGNGIGPEMAYGLMVMGLYVLVLLAVSVSGIVLLVKERRKMLFSEGPCPIRPGWRVRTVLWTGGMIAFVLVCATMFALNMMA